MRVAPLFSDVGGQFLFDCIAGYGVFRDGVDSDGYAFPRGWLQAVIFLK
ncbi:MAG: hypothetical protein ACQSGP_23380 [Frankia sp.]